MEPAHLTFQMVKKAEVAKKVIDEIWFVIYFAVFIIGFKK